MNPKITISATINANPKLVWNCYTLPEHIVHWNFASPDWQCPSAENDLTVGGKYKARMEAKDGSFGFDFEAQYTALDMGRSFSYVLEDGRQVDFNLDPSPEGSKVTIVFDAESENSLEMQEQGWQAILNNFKTYTESQS